MHTDVISNRRHYTLMDSKVSMALLRKRSLRNSSAIVVAAVAAAAALVLLMQFIKWQPHHGAFFSYLT